MFDSQEFLKNAGIVLIIIVVLFLLIREIVCWYYKINKRISIMNEQNEYLREIATTLKSQSLNKSSENNGTTKNTNYEEWKKLNPEKSINEYYKQKND